MNNNLKLIGIAVVVVVIGFTVYKLFIENNPQKDGVRVADKECECYKNKSKEIKSIYESFLSNYTKSKFKTKWSAERLIDSLIRPLDSLELVCLEKIDTAKYIKKYITDKNAIESFEYAYNAQKKLFEDDNIGVNSELLLSIRDSLRKINDDEHLFNDIVKQLYGEDAKVLSYEDAKEKWAPYNNYRVDKNDNYEFSNYYPVIRGDFNNDGEQDIAAVVKLSENGEYQTMILNVVNERINNVFLKEGEMWIFVMSKDAIRKIFMRYKGRENETGLNPNITEIVGDGIGRFVKDYATTPPILYWNGISYEFIARGILNEY